jgi:hypothetical protein
MAGGGPSRLAHLRRTVQSLRDGDLAGAAWQIAKSAVLVKVGLPLLAIAAAVLLLVAVIAGTLSSAGNAAAQACSGGQAIDVALETGDVGPVGPPAPAADVPIYQAAAAHFALGVQGPSILAAINEVETTFDTSNEPGVHSGANSKGAEGAMQFEPGTWATYGIAAPGGANPPSPYDETDAVWSAANYLHASGAPGSWRSAIYAYNHAGWYVDEVLADAAAIAQSGQAGEAGVPGGGPADVSEQCAAAATAGTQPLTAAQTATILPGGTAAAPANAPQAVKLAIAAGNELINKPYRYGGGYDQPLTSLAPSYDCASSTSFVLHGAGLFGTSAEDSTALESYGAGGPGQWITVYANSGHAFIDVAGVVLDTAWYWTSPTGAPLEQPTHPNSGPRWQPASIIPNQVTHDIYGGFVERHPAGF